MTSSISTVSAEVVRALPHLTLGREVGRGAGGSVVAAVDERSSRPVAVKVSSGVSIGGVDPRQRLRTEADILLRCRHPNLVAGIDFYDLDEVAVLVMEWVDGLTLRQAIEPLSVGESCRVVAAVASAVHAVHNVGFLHGDLKPENIFYDANRHRVRLFDLGLACRWPLSMGRAVPGTPGYLAPEGLSGRGKLLPASDVYALGMVLYELLAGCPPYPHVDDPSITVKLHLEVAPLPLRVLNPGVPASVDDLVKAAIEKDVGQRITSADELSDRLGSVVAGLEG